MGEPRSDASSVSVVLPLSEAEDSLPGLVEDVRRCVTSSIPGAEIVAVDDLSGDHTWGILRELSSSFPELRTFRMRERSGLGACSVRGVMEAQHQLIFHVEPHSPWAPDVFWLLAKRKAEMGPGAVFAARWASGRSLRERVTGRLFRDEVADSWHVPLPDAGFPAQLFARDDFDRAHVLFPEGATSPGLLLYLLFMALGKPVEVVTPDDSLPRVKSCRTPSAFASLRSTLRSVGETRNLLKNLNGIRGLVDF